MLVSNFDKDSSFLPQIYDLAEKFPELKTYRSCDLSPSSWVSLAWYVYHILLNRMLLVLDSAHHSVANRLRKITICSNFVILQCYSITIPLFSKNFVLNRILRNKRSVKIPL
jgi:hypothetical protein